MRQIYKSGIIYSLGAILFFLGACSKMNDLHDQYLQGGETLYTGRLDSARIYAGRERIKLLYWVSDPKAANLKVYWQSRKDSILFDIPSHSYKDSVEVYITNLSEYNYSFEIVTMNKKMENPSVPFQITGSSYGEKFQSTLTQRIISHSRLYPTYLEIGWMGVVESSIGCEVFYVNTDGNNVIKFVPFAEKTTLITDYLKEGKYRTLFLPEPTAIDTFYTAFNQLSIVDLSE